MNIWFRFLFAIFFVLAFNDLMFCYQIVSGNAGVLYVRGISSCICTVLVILLVFFLIFCDDFSLSETDLWFCFRQAIVRCLCDFKVAHFRCLISVL